MNIKEYIQQEIKKGILVRFGIMVEEDSLIELKIEHPKNNFPVFHYFYKTEKILTAYKFKESGNIGHIIIRYL